VQKISEPKMDITSTATRCHTILGFDILQKSILHYSPFHLLEGIDILQFDGA
jgi:hypothetical protein